MILDSQTQIIQSKIYTIRGVRVMLDRDLAELYQVKTRRLNEQVKRNAARFSEDFMFQLTKEEFENLMSQIAISRWGGIRKLPFVFTEYGVLMMASVLNSGIAIEINKKIIRAFVELRQQVSVNPDYQLLREKMRQIESKIEAIEANQIVDRASISSKVTQLSREVSRMSQILDEFQENHLIIKRPDEDAFQG